MMWLGSLMYFVWSYSHGIIIGSNSDRLNILDMLHHPVRRTIVTIDHEDQLHTEDVVCVSVPRPALRGPLDA